MLVYTITEYVNTETITNHFGVSNNIYTNFNKAKEEAKNMFAEARKILPELKTYRLASDAMDTTKNVWLIGNNGHEYRISIIERELV